MRRSDSGRHAQPFTWSCGRQEKESRSDGAGIDSHSVITMHKSGGVMLREVLNVHLIK
jgi:hypothetical protein